MEQLSVFSYFEFKFEVTINSKLIMRNFCLITNNNFIRYVIKNFDFDITLFIIKVGDKNKLLNKMGFSSPKQKN